MLKRITLFILVFLIASWNISVFAEPEIYGITAIENTTNDENDWRTYCETMPSDAATSTVIVNATEYVKDNNAAVRVEGKTLLWESAKGEVVWNIAISESGWYDVALQYHTLPGNNQDIELGLKLDGSYPYANLECFVLPRIWTDDGKKQTDSNGNEIAPKQIEVSDVWTTYIEDYDGFETEHLGLYLTEGAHTISLESFTEPFALYSIQLLSPEYTPKKVEVLETLKNQGVTEYQGADILIEAEDAYRKTSNTLVALSDNSNPAVEPSNAYVQKVNYIGGSNWSLPGQTIEWQVTVPETSIYKLGIHCRQAHLVNGNAYRSFMVNGKVPYTEFGTIPFAYQRDWKMIDSFKNGEEMLVYLEKGSNTISMSVTLGDMSDYCYQLERLVADLGVMYREIIMIISDNPDKNRDYSLFSRIANLEERMLTLCDEMNAMIDKIKSEMNDIDSTAVILKKMVAVLERMLEKQYEAQCHKSTFYDAYSGLASQLQELRNMALDVDSLTLCAPEKTPERGQTSFWRKLQYNFERFIASFVVDYNSVSESNGENEKVTLWVNWGRDQTMVLNSLIMSDFTPNYEIDVDVKMTNASLLQAIMTGEGPDCSLSVARTMPINMAMRGALVDLSELEDYDKVIERFAPTAEVPYIYQDGVYGIPSTQQFYMLYYRTDIFEQFGLSVPKTWDEFLEISRVLLLNNLEVGLPYTQLSDISQTDGGAASLSIFPSLLQQFNVPLYNMSLTATTLTESDTISVFKYWTEFYTMHDFPRNYSFYNRFRIGLMPMAIDSYGQYAVLSAAAPEIKGDWAMAEIPGVVLKDGTINNTQAGSGTAAVILKQSKNVDAAWKLLEWWMADETQYQYAVNIESILGASGRHATANQNAMLRLGWDSVSKEALTKQWEKIVEQPEVPGGYYVSRAIEQAFWNVVSMGKAPRDQMVKWGEIANDEIRKKVEQYQ